MIDDLDSSSKGIWILPYEPTPSESESETEAGPSRRQRPRSRPRLLKRAYDHALQAYHAAHEAYEDQRTEEQLDGISDWLASSSAPNPGGVRYHRLPVGIIQQPGSRLLRSLHDSVERTKVLGVQGRDMVDLASCVRCITTGLLPDVPTKSGLTGLDKVEKWWKGLKDSPSILIHVQDAQIMNPAILAEFMYILTLHPELPVRLLLSVPSIRTFLSQWSMIEPSSIDLTILTSTRSRRRQNAVAAILESVDRDRVGARGIRIRVGDDLAERLKTDERMYGSGPQSALRALQWSMLHHEANSPLATLLKDSRPSELGAIQAILENVKANPEDDVPGRNLFEIPTTRDLDHVMDPSPRISILHALSNTSSYTSALPPLPHTADPGSSPKPKHPETPTKKSNLKRTAMPKPPPPGEVNGEGNNHETRKGSYGDIKDLEILYNLWKGAGKSVNLWDWLQGYMGSFSNEDDGHGQEEEEVGLDEGDEPARVSLMRKRKRAQQEKEGEENENENENEVDIDGQEKERDEEEEGKKRDRLHASFVRFCEEARMLGMVRARGKGVGRRADEVVKGVTLV